MLKKHKKLIYILIFALGFSLFLGYILYGVYNELVLPMHPQGEGSSTVGYKVSPDLNEKLVRDIPTNDAENGYAETKRFLSELSIPQGIISELSDSQLDFFAKSNSISAYSTDGLEYEPQMRIIIAMQTSGKMRIIADVEWSKLPKDLYTDLISVNKLPLLLTSYENASLKVTYNGSIRTLTPDKDYKVYHVSNRGQVGVTFDLGRLLKDVNVEGGMGLRFEIEVINAAYRDYDLFGANLLYQHSNTKHDGKTKVGGDDELGFKFNPRSKMKYTYYLMSSGYPLSYYPEGFEQESKA